MSKPVYSLDPSVYPGPPLSFEWVLLIVYVAVAVAAYRGLKRIHNVAMAAAISAGIAWLAVAFACALGSMASNGSQNEGELAVGFLGLTALIAALIPVGAYLVRCVSGR